MQYVPLGVCGVDVWTTGICTVSKLVLAPGGAGVQVQAEARETAESGMAMMEGGVR